MNKAESSQFDDLKAMGLKVTEPRLKILSLFKKATLEGERHLSAEEVYKRLLQENSERKSVGRGAWTHSREAIR